MAGDEDSVSLAVRVGAAIRGIRQMRGYSLRYVADHPAMSTTAQTVSRLENGNMSLSMEWLEGLATALQVPVTLFFADVGDMSVDEFITREVNTRLTLWLRARLADIEEMDGLPQEQRACHASSSILTGKPIRRRT